MEQRHHPRIGCGIVLWCVAACSSPPQAPSLDASKAQSFVAYQEQLIPLERDWAQKHGEPVVVKERLEQLRTASGLSERDIKALNEIGALVVVRGEALKDELSKYIAEQKQAVARAPESARAATQQSLDDLERMRANVFGLEQMRQKYGNAIVDAMLLRESQLKRQQFELASAR